MVADTQSVTLTTELPGRTAAFLDAEVRPQVSGILVARRFEEGQDVTEGDILYDIEPPGTKRRSNGPRPPWPWRRPNCPR